MCSVLPGVLPSNSDTTNQFRLSFCLGGNRRRMSKEHAEDLAENQFFHQQGNGKGEEQSTEHRESCNCELHNDLLNYTGGKARCGPIFIYMKINKILYI